MKYQIESINKRGIKNNEIEYTAFDIVLKEPVNGVGCATVQAKTKKQAILHFEEVLKNHVQTANNLIGKPNERSV